MTSGSRLTSIVELLLVHGELEHCSEVLLLCDDALAIKNLLEQSMAAMPQEKTCEPRIEVCSLAEVTGDHNILHGRRWSLVCVIDPQLGTIPLTRLLSALRDLHADQVLHIDDTADWTLSSSLALGFRQLHNAENLTVFGFDIHTYKSVPSWLNSRHWANPELWGKHRW